MSQESPGSVTAAQSAQETSRRRLVWLSSIVLGLVALLLLAWFVLSHPTGAAPAPKPTPSPTASVLTQPTLLFQVEELNKPFTIGNALTSVGGPKDMANDVTIPSNVIVDAGTAGEMTFGKTVVVPDGNASANALSDVTGIRVDATLMMDPLGFSALVDAVGGVTTDVDVEVVEIKPDGTTVPVLPAGKGQILQGPKALAYASYLAPGEAESARMARFDRVFRLVLAQLPSGQTKMEEIITSLGSSSHSTLPTPAHATYLVRLHDAVVADKTVYRNLPVVPAGLAYPDQSRVNILPTTAMARKLFPDALRVPGPNSKVRVLVQNGVGSPSPMQYARTLLVDGGYSYVNGGAAAEFGQKKSRILVPDSSSTAMGWGADIAKTLGLPKTDIQAAAHGQTVADVIVVLGQDFAVDVTPTSE